MKQYRYVRNATMKYIKMKIILFTQKMKILEKDYT